MSIGSVIKEHRIQRGLSQIELARLTGYSGAFISNIENEKYKFTSPEALSRFAKALKINPEQLYIAAGAIKDKKGTYSPQRLKTPAELLTELEVSMPIAIPIVADIHAGPSDASEYVYWAPSKLAPKSLTALKVIGFCMAPDIKEGDVIIIDTDITHVKDDSIVACHDDGQIWLKRYGEHKGCHIYGIVIGINRKL